MAGLYEESQKLWVRLTDEEREIACSSYDELQKDSPVAVKTFLELEALADEVYKALQGQELKKVQDGLARLRKWLASGTTLDLV